MKWYLMPRIHFKISQPIQEGDRKQEDKMWCLLELDDGFIEDYYTGHWCTAGNFHNIGIKKYNMI